jgi:hypothetical protein
MVILRAFQLLKSKVRHWADLNNRVKRRNYMDKQKAYVLAKKQFRVIKKQLISIPGT